MNWKRIRRWLLSLTLICLLGLAVLAWWIGGALVAPAHRRVGPPPADLPAVTHAIQSQSGSILATWYVPAPDASDSRATIVLLHAIRGNRNSMLNHARMFHAAGFAVVLADLQAHGESSGEHITVGHLESHDARALIRFAHQENPDHRIGVLGRSLGGAAALLGVPFSEEESVDALAVESVYPTVTKAVSNRIAMRMGSLVGYVLTPALVVQLRPRLGISASDLRPIDHIGQVDCPVLVIGGSDDAHTTKAETELLFQSASEPKRLSMFDGAGHEDLLRFDPEKYQRDVLGFFLAQLKPNIAVP